MLGDPREQEGGNSDEEELLPKEVKLRKCAKILDRSGGIPRLARGSPLPCP